MCPEEGFEKKLLCILEIELISSKKVSLILLQSPQNKNNMQQAAQFIDEQQLNLTND